MSKEILEGEVVADELMVQEENELYVSFNKPFTFEGKEYAGIDLSEMEDMNGKQLLDISKKYAKLGGSAILPENDIQYAILVAAEVCKLPLEFFYKLPQRELVKLRIKVLGFYFQGE